MSMTSTKPGARSSSDGELRVHRDWLSTLQPVGLVVSPPALVAAQAAPDRNIVRQQQALLSLCAQTEARQPARKVPSKEKCVDEFLALCRDVLDWPIDDDSLVVGRAGGAPLPEALCVPLPEFGETLRPSYAVRDLYSQSADGEEPGWALLIKVLIPRTPLDDPGPEEGRKWHASPQVRLERLLRETGVPAGLLYNGVELRLCYAPRGESSGHLTWPIAALCEVGGRPLLSALCMLLGRAPLSTVPSNQRLLHILRESRKYQNVVSNQLAGQVLEALNELLRGFQAANAATRGQLLDTLVRQEPLHVYGGLLASLLRLVFILYAEERGLLSTDEVYVRGYSLTGLFEKLRQDAGRFPDTMDQRYGAWAQLCVLFRLIYDGAQHGTLTLPARKGHLFDPDGWPFLEGRPRVGGRQHGVRLELPKVADGVVYRVLDKLLLLGGDRLSYRALDVEQIGSVYEGMMGFTLERAAAVSLGVGRAHVVIDLEALLATKPADRAKWLKEHADCELTGKAATALKTASTLDELVAALDRRRSPLTPQAVPRGGLYLQPTDERRRSGSHYTPRELTEPIVRKTLAPLLADLGPAPTPQQLLALRVCDPAMGSGAFLVECCRQLAEQLLRSWDVHGKPQDKPDDEEPLLFAQRLVAQRCLYGVDKNPFAVDLGKLSLWLATLARQHCFTFVDHALRHGDSLVGLSREQIACFHWQPDKQLPILRARIDRALGEAEALRLQIQELAHKDDDASKLRLLKDANEALADVRLIGDCVVACFFAGENDKKRKLLRKEWEAKVSAWLDGTGNRQELVDFVSELREGERPVPVFHWELEYPEVFHREQAGFDAFVGNPPFLGGRNLTTSHGESYNQFLVSLHAESSGASDLVAHFFRRGFYLLRANGTMGMVATNTVSQGDTRSTGLRWICTHGGSIYNATKRYKWPGHAAVVVSIVHIKKGCFGGVKYLDEKAATTITAFLFHNGGSDDPVRLQANANKTFQGCVVLGMGFTFDDENQNATAITEMHRIVQTDPRNGERIFPFIGGEEINDSPTHCHSRYIINFGELSKKEAQRWPDLIKILETKVKPERMKKSREMAEWPWWQFWRPRRELYSAMAGLKHVLTNSQTSSHLAFAYQPTDRVFSHALNVIILDKPPIFAILQCRAHEIWARFFGSSLEDRLRYTPSDCFETFPFPPSWESHPTLEAVGKEYYEFRAQLMVRNNEGLTTTYNRFHDPDEFDPEIRKLRALHDDMDRAVLDAYGWTDLRPSCEFLLDYEEAEEEAEEEPGRPRRKKKPWRYRWPDAIRDEVLARLLALNAERAQKEKEEAARAALLGERASKPRNKRTPPAGSTSGGQGSLF